MNQETNPIDPVVREGDHGRHPLHIGHLVMGLAFTGIAVLWLISASEIVPNDDLRLLLPLPFLLAGGLGLLALVLVGRRRE